MIYYTSPKCSYSMYESERRVRHKLMYYFNPCLKYMFNWFGQKKFAQYGFNSCRQTAILGAAFCHFELPGSKVTAYEADFEDVYKGQDVNYAHAYFRVEYGVHDWLVDISRTESMLLFTRTKPVSIYPGASECPDYANANILAIRPLNWPEMLMTENPEWITELRPLELFQEVCHMAKSMEDWSHDGRVTFAETIYRQFTSLPFERSEFRDESFHA